MSAKPIRLFWWAPKRNLRLLKPELEANPMAWSRLAFMPGRTLTNFGDEMSALALALASGRPITWSNPKDAEVVGIGSVLELCFWAGFEGHIWGSGLRHERRQDEDLSATLADQILAVRGPDTRDSLGMPSSTVMGDPGLLAARMIDPARVGGVPRPMYLPHFRTWASAEGRASVRFAVDHGFDVVQPTIRPEQVIRSIAKAEFLTTSSLHGLIVANALGVPVQLVASTSEADQEPDFKFGDYFGSIGFSHRPVGWRSMGDRAVLRGLIEERRSDADVIAQRAELLAGGLLRAASTLRSS